MADIKLKDILKRVFTKEPGKNTAKTVFNLFGRKKTDIKNIEFPIISYQTGKIYDVKELVFPEDKTRDTCEILKDKNEKITSEKEKKIYYMPVTYKMFGRVPVKAESLKKAYDIIRDNSDTVPLPVNRRYIRGSLIAADDISAGRDEDITGIQKFILPDQIW